MTDFQNNPKLTWMFEPVWLEHANTIEEALHYCSHDLTDTNIARSLVAPVEDCISVVNSHPALTETIMEPFLGILVDGDFSIITINSTGEPLKGNDKIENINFSEESRPRDEFFLKVIEALGNRKVLHVLCCPTNECNALIAIAIRECFGAKLGVLFMHDAEELEQLIPDSKILIELLEKSHHQFTSSERIQQSIQLKFMHKISKLNIKVHSPFGGG